MYNILLLHLTSARPGRITRRALNSDNSLFVRRGVDEVEAVLDSYLSYHALHAGEEEEDAQQGTGLT